MTGTETSATASRWIALALVLAGLVAWGFGARAHDFFVADDFSALYVASRSGSLAEALDVRGTFRESLVREIDPNARVPATLMRPLSTLTMWFDHMHSGSSPRGYHVTAFAIHALNALLVAALAVALGAGFLAAAGAAALFALHPAHPEAVVWIAARADVLVTTFMLLAMLAWLRWIEGGRARSLALAALATALALGTKEMAATLPGLAVALALVRRPPGWIRRTLVGAAVLAAVVGAYLLARWWLIGNLTGYAPRAGGIASALASNAHYLADAVRYAVMPGDRIAHPEPDALRLGTGAAWLLLTLAAWRRGSGGRLAWPLAGLGLAFVFSTVPAATWGSLSADGQSSRFLYPSLVFAVVAAARLAHEAAAHRAGRALAATGIVALLVLAGAGLRRALVPWGEAAALSERIVTDLRAVAPDKQAYVMTNEMPSHHGPAYVAQNAFPPAIWAFVSRGARVEFVLRPAWDQLIREKAEFIRTNADTVAAVRWDGLRRAWVGPMLRR